MGKLIMPTLTCLHALGQHADASDLLSVDDLVAVDEGQVGLGRHKRLTAETLKVLHTFLRHQVLKRQRSCDQSPNHPDQAHLAHHCRELPKSHSVKNDFIYYCRNMFPNCILEKNLAVTDLS